jgi:hypothetical protein
MSNSIANIDPNDLLIPSPVGIDKKIQDLQLKLADKLTWLTKSFGKAYREEIEDGVYQPQIFRGNNEYVDVFPDNNSSITAMSFFDVDQDRDMVGDSGQYNLEFNVRVIFFVDLSKAYPSATHRADEDVIMDAVNVIRNHRRGWDVASAIVGVENVFTSYNWDEKEALIHKQPYFVFSIETDLIVDGYKKCIC